MYVPLQTIIHHTLMRKLFTYIMLLSTMFTHAQCMKVHHSDGWTEEIPVENIDGDVCFNSVYTALKNGYRLIDTAYMFR